MDEYTRLTETLKESRRLKKRGEFFAIGVWAMMFCVLATLSSYISWYFIGLQLICGIISLYYIEKSIKILKEA